jgi:hypothetical protein
MEDPLLALTTLSAMRVHREFGHQNWVKEPQSAEQSA